MLAGVIAAMAESWPLFFLLALIFIGLSLHSGDIRPKGKGRTPRR